MTDSTPTTAAPWLREEGARLRDSLGSRHRWATRRAWLRSTLDRHLFRYNLEHCEACGRRVGLSWWSTAGWTNVVRDGGLIRCIRCFDREAWAIGEPVCWLAVTFEEFDRHVGVYFDACREDPEAARNAGLSAEAWALVEAARHQPEPGGCTCGFCAWSVEHVVIMSVREGVRRAGL